MFLHFKQMGMYLCNSSLFLFCILVAFTCKSSVDNPQSGLNESSTQHDYLIDTLKVLCTQDQLQLVLHLKEAYQECHDEIPIEIALYEGVASEELLSQAGNDLILVSDLYSTFIPGAYCQINYARDGLVGIVHQSHPFYREILETGLGKQQLTLLLTGGNSDSWKQAAGYEQPREIKVFTGPDESMPCKKWVKFLGIEPADLRMVATASFQDMIDSVCKVPLSIGLCCSRHAYDQVTRKEIEGISVIRMDCNANGMLEDKENFYADLDELQRAIWLGKYPCHSYINYYILAKGNPANMLHLDFMKFVLTEGQQNLPAEGFIKLNTHTIQGEIDKINRLQAIL